MAFGSLLILLAVVLAVAYFQTPVLIWTGIIAATLLLLTVFGHLGFILLTLCWLLFIAAAVFANAKQLRQQYIMKPLIQKLAKNMPTISNTEREAIEAGNVWWEKDLFCGRPQWKKLHAMPAPTLTAEEQAFIDNQVDKLCKMLNDWQLTHVEHDLPKAVWDYLKQEKFLGMIIPKEFGGLGFSALAHSTVILKIATRSISTAVNTMVPNSLGPAELLLHYGTAEQKNYYLPRLAKGEEIPCFALTSPEAGSDAGAMIDKGIVCRGEYEGKETLGIRLTWDKRYITLAPIATVLGIAFKLYDPDHLLGAVEDIGITLCLVPTNHPGVEIGHRHYPLFLAFMNGPTRGTDVFIPIDWIIGGTAMAGHGWRMLMECLSVGRAISLPALSTACGKLTYRTTGAYARIRKQFNTAISNFEGVEEALSDIAGYTYILESCRVMTAGAVDQHIKPAIASAIAKYNMTELARKTIDHAMDVHAGHAIQVGPRNFLANAHLAIPVSITVEGANILTRNLIIFGQGAIRCHPYILQEIALFAAHAEEDKTQELDKILLSHMGYVISNFARSFWNGITGGIFILAPTTGRTAYCYRQLTRMSTALALLSDVTMLILGGALKRKERISAKLGDMLSQLYLGSAVLKYFYDQGKPATDLPYVQWCIDHCLYKIQTACDDLLNNFPIRWLGKVLHWFIFPWGRAYHAPRDTVSHQIVETMLQPSDFRERLTRYCFITNDTNDAICRLETALAEVAEIDPIWKKFHIATRDGKLSPQMSFDEQVDKAINLGILTTVEANRLREFDALRKEVIKVDEFSFDLKTVLT